MISTTHHFAGNVILILWYILLPTPPKDSHPLLKTRCNPAILGEGFAGGCKPRRDTNTKHQWFVVMPGLSLLCEQPLQPLPILASNSDVQAPRPHTSSERDNDYNCAMTPNDDNQLEPTRMGGRTRHAREVWRLLKQRDLPLSNADGSSVLEYNLVIEDY